MVKTFVWSVLMYGCETWTISRAMEKRLEAAEMWIWRKVLGISWIDRVSNVQVLERVNTVRELLRKVRERQLQFLGHVMRGGKLENLCLTGRIEGRRARGRQRETYLDGLKRVTGEEFSGVELLRKTDNREEWRSMIANALSGMAH